MIKKILAATLMLVSLSVFADHDKDKVKIKGEIVSVDAAAKTFVLKDVNNMKITFKVTPETDFETKCKSCLIEDSILPVDFEELKAGDWVKVESEGTTEVKVAKDVEIYRN